tara:strand:- start:6596 stop:7678 length:1083 start_codon:yes stop_codon:yes gene_type:complete
MKKTSLYNEHINLNAKLVDFAGYQMPIQYKGIIDEHLAVRESCGIFDVSHMGEFIISGEGSEEFLNEITINDVSKIDPWQAQYSAMCYEDGGIIDDILIYKYPEHYMLVVNCSNIEKNFDWIIANKPKDVDFANISSTIELIALQGPLSREILNKYTDIDLKNVDYYRFCIANVCGFSVMLSRTGYTGELGYEIYADGNSIRGIWTSLLETEKEIIPAGLGCRDTLRMEMKYVLYGNDINEKTNPIEAGLGWITKTSKTSFIGKEKLLELQLSHTKKLICFEMIDRGIPRLGYSVTDGSIVVGSVTSGTQSPSLKKGIGLAYVDKKYSKAGTQLSIDVRGKQLKCEIVKAPFYKKGSVFS